MRSRSLSAAMRHLLWRLMVIGAALAFGACSMLHRGKSANAAAPAEPSAHLSEASSEASPSAESTPAESAPAAESSPAEGAPTEGAPAEGGTGDANSAPPGATVAISYAHKGDYLASLSVSKFNGTEMVESRNIDAQHVASIIRFDGGVTVWEIERGHRRVLEAAGGGLGRQVRNQVRHLRQAARAFRASDAGKRFARAARSRPLLHLHRPARVGHLELRGRAGRAGRLAGRLRGGAARRHQLRSVLQCNPDFVQPTAPVIPQGSGPSP